MIGFDADVLIYAAVRDHPLGTKVRELLADTSLQGQRVGSVLLLPELLSKPLRQEDEAQVRLLRSYLQRLTLLAVDRAVGALAAQLGAAYGPRAADAVHLATAVHAGAERFLTNNRKDFEKAKVLELEVIYPDELAGPGEKAGLE